MMSTDTGDRLTEPDADAPPHYHYGWVLGICELLAELADEHGGTLKYGDEHLTVMGRVGFRGWHFPRHDELARRCYRVLPSDVADQFREALAEALSRLPGDGLEPNFNVDQQWHVILGYHHAAVREPRRGLPVTRLRQEADRHVARTAACLRQGAPDSGEGAASDG